MDKVEALKNIAGSSASGDTIVEVLESMSGVVDKVNSNVEDIDTLETSVGTLETSVGTLETSVDALEEKFPTPKEIVLASSTAESTKKFKITVVDAGTISATEIVEA